jgi:small RNA 2'-O-methyltransferase
LTGRSRAAKAARFEMTQTTRLHEARLDHVCAVLKSTGARRVLDLGCGSGGLLLRLLRESQFEAVVGVDDSGRSLALSRDLLGRHLQGPAPRLRLLRGSYLNGNDALVGFQAAAMVETIEHVDPGQLSRLERAVFGGYRPGVVYVTTPNADFNPMLGLAAGEFREPDHRFEWGRARFRQWALGVAKRNGYRVRFGGIGDADPEFGAPTQTAWFERIAEA